VEQKSAGELREHMLWTYYGLRVGLVVIGGLLPVLVVAAGFAHGGGLRGSLSDYYNVTTSGFLTPRDIFAGGLLAAAACLYLYKGYSDKENIALNLSGIAAATVAFFPTGPDGPVTYLHRAAAVFFFLSIAYVCLFRATDTLDDDLLPEARLAWYALRYQILGALMLASPFVALALSWWLRPGTGKSIAVLLIEAFGVWVFASYWWAKTLEMRESEAEKRTLEGSLKRVVKPEAPGTGTAPKAAPGRPSKRRDEKIVRAA
jgi:hypothetical protein